MVPIEVVALAFPLASKAKIDEGVPLMRDDPMVEVATTLPFTSVVRSEFVSEVKKVVPRVVKVEEAFENVWRLLQMFALLKSVEEAALMVPLDPRAMETPFTVSDPDPVRSPLPIVEVATTVPCALVVRRAFGVFEMVRAVVEAEVKKALVALKAVDDAPPVKVWRLLQVLVVVVPKPRERVMLPVAALVRSG